VLNEITNLSMLFGEQAQEPCVLLSITEQYKDTIPDHYVIELK